jgi:hypothetical protein
VQLNLANFILTYRKLCIFEAKTSMRHIVFAILLLCSSHISGQKQTNDPGSDIVAEAPWRMTKTDGQGNALPLPLHVFIKDADVVGFNAELIYVNVYIKNASSSSFGNPLLFDTMTVSSFMSLFTSVSANDPVYGHQSFYNSLPVKSSTNTIEFTSHNCAWPDVCTYTDITEKAWFFTLNIPEAALAGFEDIIDIKVYFSLNWQADEEVFLRVFRYDEPLPSVPGWYRGDMHFHSDYTNNTAEYGLPLKSSRETAKAIGLDWIAVTDHSCDYDNYGNNIAENWMRKTDETELLNLGDPEFIYIPATEASVLNSAGDVIHMLVMPADTAPYNLPFLGDGDGDALPTDVTISDILNEISIHGGFSFAAHPFASKDELSSLVDGGIWNVSDTLFLANGSPCPGYDVVICNDPGAASDFYASQSGSLFHPLLKGGQVWNTRNALTTTDEMTNPWNAEQESDIDGFVPYNPTDNFYHRNRFLSGLEVSKFFWRKGLLEKNANPLLSNYRFVISAGSDAHGSFNYSNTDFVLGVTNDINDNAPGRPSTLVWIENSNDFGLPELLRALEKGNIILSDGPVLVAKIISNPEQYLPGDEYFADSSDYSGAVLTIDVFTNDETGTPDQCILIVGTEDQEISVPMAIQPFQQSLSYTLDLDSLADANGIQPGEYYYIRAELQTYWYYGPLSSSYARSDDYFHCYTNPLWVRHALVTRNTAVENQANLTLHPNPANNEVIVKSSSSSKTSSLTVVDSRGIVVEEIDFESETTVDISRLSPGVYLFVVNSGESICRKKLVVY